MAEFLEVLKAFLKFPDALSSLAALLKKTPQENHEDLVKKMTDEAEKFQREGKPSW